jgi:hypothetical protein
MSLLASTPKTYPASLLLNFDGSFSDSSSYNHTVTNSNASISSAQSKFGGSSGYFNGTNSSLQINTSIEFGTENWTTELWIYPLYGGATSTWGEPRILSRQDAGTGFVYQLRIYEGSPEVLIRRGDGSDYTEIKSTSKITANTWHHIAVTRNGNVVSLFLNGNLEATNAFSGSYNSPVSAPWIVGAFNDSDGGSASFFWNGYIDDLRVVKGVAIYGGQFSPPGPLSRNAIFAPKTFNHIVMTSTKSSGDITGRVSTSTGYYTVNWWDGTKTTYPSDSNFTKAAIGGNQSITIYPSQPTSLILNFTGNNNSIVFTDSSSSNHTVTPYGNAKISTTQSKPSGGSSGYFDGTGDYLDIRYNSVFDLSKGPWTLEAWFYATSLPANVTVSSAAIISKDRYGSSFDYNINVAQNGIVFLCNNVANSSSILYSYTTISTNNWHHVAIVSDGSTCSVYFNGTLINSKVFGDSFIMSNATNSNISIGCNSSTNNPNSFFTGYIDDVRIVKGKALYTSNFTPPTSELTEINLDLSGYFLNVNLSNNNLISVRPFHSRFIESAGTPGYSQYGYFYSSYYYKGWRWNWIPGIPAVVYRLDVSSNSLDSSALNQIYTDLLNGDGTIDVSDNTGGDSDDPSIATTKGYTVYGSIAPYTTLLLNLNSNYTDSSSQNISVSGLTGSPSFSTSIKKYGSAALSLNGGATIPSFGTSSFSIPDLSQVDWTVEFWIYRPTATAGYEGIIYLANSSSSIGLNMHLYTNNSFNFNDGAAPAITNNYGVIGSGQWYHVAGVSRNNIKKLFVNGTLVSSATQATPAGPYKLSVGRSLDGYWITNGLKSTAYIDDLRIIRGKALYTGDFIVPSSELTTSTSSVSAGVTRLLLNFNGENNSTVFTDSSIDNLTITKRGTPVISISQNKFGGSSGYFNGSSSLTNSSLSLATSDFTIEAWIYVTTANINQTIVNQGDSDSTGNFILWIAANNKIAFYADNYDRISATAGITTISPNQWYHIAFTRSGSTYRTFVNGYLDATCTFSPNHTGSPFKVGDGYGGIRYFNGYIEDLRIVKGKVLYTSNFTPPTSELTTSI